MNSAAYRAKHGRQSPVKWLRATPSRKGDLKPVTCPVCASVWNGPWSLAWARHDLRCRTCRWDAKWAGLKEFEDYVTCLDCGYRAGNLTSHLRHNHVDYRLRHPNAAITARSSPIRDKRALKGITRSQDFRNRVREAKLLNLVRDDFEPFIEPDGTVDFRAMLCVVGCAWPTLRRYIFDLGLRPTQKYRRLAADQRRVSLTPSDLDQYRLANGRVSIAAAMTGLNLSFPTVKRECQRLGLPATSCTLSQAACLKTVSQALGGKPYVTEWSSDLFQTASGRLFRFDGFFPEIQLLVEFQGHQHYTFPNAFQRREIDRSDFEAMCERDRRKRALVEAHGGFLFLEIREDEPFKSVEYVRTRLDLLGALSRPNMGSAGEQRLCDSLISGQEFVPWLSRSLRLSVFSWAVMEV